MEGRDREGWLESGGRLRLLVPLLALTGLALVLDLRHLDFPLGYHADEAGKVGQILAGRHTFFHPLLLIQSARLFLVLGGGEGEIAALLAGRTVSAFAGALLVPAVFLLARRALPPSGALLATAAAAFAPLTVIHAHYLKEDALLTLFVVLSLAAALHLREKPSTKAALLWGLTGGLMLAAKYVGALFLGIQLLYLLHAARRAHGESPQAEGERGGAQGRSLALGLPLGVAVTLGVFALVNLPALLQPRAAVDGLLFEARHVAEGHGPFTFSPVAFLGLFHLRFSLVPGLGLPLLALCFAGGVVLFSLSSLRPLDRLAGISALALYLVAELTPTKPFPDAMRYLLPAVPLLAVLGVRGLWALRGRWPGAFRAGIVLWLLATVWTAWDSARLVAAIDNDTREEARAWVVAQDEPARRELFAAARPDVESVARLDPAAERARGVRYLVASSFLYQWVFRACEHGGCTPEGEALAAGYRRLFLCPYRELRPETRAFAFHRPTLRIVDLERCPPEVIGKAPAE